MVQILAGPIAHLASVPFCAEGVGSKSCSFRKQEFCLICTSEDLRCGTLKIFDS